MKNIFTNQRIIKACFILLASLACVPAFAQNDFDKKINELSSTLAKNIAQNNKKKIAVIDFSDTNGKINELGKVTAEDIGVNLVSSGKGFQVVDRLHAQNIMKKYNLDKRSLADPETIKEIGRIANVDAVVMGTFSDFGKEVRVSAKVYDSQTARIIGAGKTYLTKSGAVANLMGSKTGATSNNTSTKVAEKKKERKVLTALNNGFTFQLTECKRNGKTVKCKVLITNHANNDRGIKLYSNRYRATTAYTADGNSYISSRQTLGRKTQSISVEALAIREIPVAAGVEFNGVDTNTSSFKMIEFDFDTFKVRFNDVEID